MKKIPSLAELRPQDDAGDTDADAVANAATSAAFDPVSPAPAGHGDRDAAIPVLASDQLPADVFEHAVRLGEAAPEPAAPSRGAVRKSSGSRQNVRRRYSRERAVQALYAWDVGDSSASEVLRYFLDHQDMSRADVAWFQEAFTGVAHDPAPIDALLAPVIDRGLHELDPVERAIIRLGAWELQVCSDTPVRVVINEAIEVAKRFGAEQGHRFVNGALDTLARQLRAAEIG